MSKTSKIKRRSSSFDIRKYHINFDSVWKNNEMRNAFYTFAKSQFNSEPIDFINEVEKLKDVEDFNEHARFIINEFIITKAPREINLSYQNKNKLLEQFEKIEKENSRILCQQCFIEAKKIVMLELFKDVFPRFIRSSICSAVVEKLIDDESVVALKHVVNFPYTDEDFIGHYVVYNKDIDFANALALDNFDWELVGRTGTKKNPLMSFFNHQNYMPKVSFFSNASVAKFEGILPYPFEKVIVGLVPMKYCYQYDDNVMGYEEIRYLSHEEVLKESKIKEKHRYHKRTSVVTMIDVKLPFPMKTPRKYPIVSTIEYDPNKEELTMVHKPFCSGEGDIYYKKYITDYVHTNKNEKKKLTKCMVMLDFQSYHIRKLDENRTYFIQIHVFDLGGWASSTKLQKLALKERGENLRKSYMEHLDKFPDDVTIESVTEDLKKDPLGRLLADVNVKEVRERYKKELKL